MGLRGWIRGSRGSQEVAGGREGIQGIPWGHRNGLMRLLMIHKAYICLYISDADFYCGTDEQDERTNRPKVVQEVLGDLKNALKDPQRKRAQENCFKDSKTL